MHEAPLQRWLLETPEGEILRVWGSNWIVAFGQGLDQLGVMADLERVAGAREGIGRFSIIDIPSGRHYALTALDPPQQQPQPTARGRSRAA